ncbi:hypothetical protein [Streptomyces sp. NBC_00470]|uniref:hypothetical protein n=1 Tax=Streptomyces sp. NBC_00470 TaxID=2975753 RepID=UPI002F91B572
MRKSIAAAATLTVAATLATVGATATPAAADQACSELVPAGWETCEREVRDGQVVYTATWANGDTMTRPSQAAVTGESFEIRNGKRVKITDYSDGSQKVRPAPQPQPKRQAQPATPTPVTGAGTHRVTPSVGVAFRDESGNRTGSGISPADRFTFSGTVVIAGTTYYRATQTTTGVGGWGDLRSGLVPAGFVVRA